MMGNQYWAQVINTNPIFTSRKKAFWKKNVEENRLEEENKIKQCFIVNTFFVFWRDGGAICCKTAHRGGLN